MKKLTGLLAAVVFATTLTGCIVAPVVPTVGIIYNDTKAPLDYTQESSAVGSKTGISSTMSICGLVSLGDGSIKAAADAGGIKTINGADYEFFNVLGIYQKYTTVVNGD